MNRVDTACAIVAEHLTLRANPQNFDAYYTTVLRSVERDARPTIVGMAERDREATARSLAGRYLTNGTHQLPTPEPESCPICAGAFHGRGVVCPARLADQGLARVLVETIKEMPA